MRAPMRPTSRTTFAGRPLLFACTLALPGCDGAPTVQQFGGPTMGSTYEVKYVGDVPLADVRAAVEEELAAFDFTFSQWRDDSEIARCNQHASTAPFPASPRFQAVLREALQVAAATEGAFDPTVKPLSDLYRAAKQDPEHRFDEAVAAAARAHVDYRQIEVRDGAVHKKRPDVLLDLDGIVAGAAADAVAARLQMLGVSSFYLEVTGEVLCRGEKTPGAPWIIGVVDPIADQRGGDMPVRTLALRDRALCTSGGYRNAMVVDGRVVHHVFDPRTGKNPDHRAVSASVLARSAALADAFGTAFLVLGDEKTGRLLPGLQQFGDIGVLFLVVDDGGPLKQVEFAWPQQ